MNDWVWIWDHKPPESSPVAPRENYGVFRIRRQDGLCLAWDGWGRDFWEKDATFGADPNSVEKHFKHYLDSGCVLERVDEHSH